MIQHILLATDGSSASAAAIQPCVDLAKALDAHITGLHVIRLFHAVGFRPAALDESRAQYGRDSELRATKFLAPLEVAARDADVACKTLHVWSDHPYQAIIETARIRHCGLIVMATHGRKGFKSVLLGSVTQKVLAHATVPVLAYRKPAGA